MRAGSLTFGCTLAFAVAISLLPGRALAQDEFDDEFGDEFGEGEGNAQQGGDDAPPAEDEEDEFGDDFEDDLEQAEGEGDGDGAEEEEEEEGAAAPPDEELRGRRLRSHPTLYGPVGGIRVVDASPGAAQSFRVQLVTDFFFQGNFLNSTGGGELGLDPDTNDHIGGYLALSWTVHDYVEVFASITSYANSNDTEEPALFQVLGDTLLGVKFGYDIAPFFTLGGDLSVAFLNTVGDIGVVFDSTSFGIRANGTLDLRGLDSPIPLVARLGFQYWFDNSVALVSGVEQLRYEALPMPMAIENETRHLITRVERFALNINRTDFMRIGLGLEAPLKVMEDFYIHPLLEWTLNIPINRSGYDCLFIEDPAMPGSGRPPLGTDGCLARTGFAAFPQDLTLGVRVLPPLDGLGVLLGVDIGLTGTGIDDAVRELAANAPYNVMIGLSYAYDLAPPPVPEPVIQEVERRVEVRTPAPPKGRINGTVVEQGAGTPAAGAVVRFPGTEHSPIVADDAGHFRSYEFDPGDVPMEITHDEYNPGSCVGTIGAEGGDVEVRCELVALPRVGSVQGRVLGEEGAAISAEVQIAGPTNRSVRSDAAGSFNAAELTPGSYSARVEAEGYLIKLQQFEVRPREVTNIQIDLVPRPRQPLVRVQRTQIQIRRQIHFATDSAEILSDSHPLMAEIADVIMRNPDLQKIEIQGHTDNRGTAEHNLDLSSRRAESVRQWLVDNGVEMSRLDAQGYGMTRPLVPNITPANRARNRRVQFMITERTPAAGAAAPEPAAEP